MSAGMGEMRSVLAHRSSCILFYLTNKKEKEKEYDEKKEI